MRKLATIRKINDLQPIEGADKIELAIVDGWKVVVEKGLYKIKDYVIYCEIDSWIPTELAPFLSKGKEPKEYNGVKGEKLKTIKLRGALSQGLILPITCLTKEPSLNNYESMQQLIFSNRAYDLVQISPDCEIDVTAMLGIQKYEPPVPAQLAGICKGNFPSFLRKTDEERVQNLTREYQEYLKDYTRFYATEKLDGSSATFYLRDGVFGVCSRNLELKEEVYVPEDVLCEDGIIRTKKQNSFWKVARELDIENKLKQLPFNACLQGELIGEGIQGNPYKIKGQSVRFFNLFNIDTHEYKPIYDLDNFCNENDLQTVPIVGIVNFTLPSTIDELLILAEGKSSLFDCEREGLVIRDIDNKISFKVISNKFLINNNNN